MYKPACSRIGCGEVSGLKFSRRGKGGQPSLFPRIFLLALLFAAGVFAGRIFARDLPDSVGQELSDYLQQYMMLIVLIVLLAAFGVICPIMTGRQFLSLANLMNDGLDKWKTE